MEGGTNSKELLRSVVSRITAASTPDEAEEIAVRLIEHHSSLSRNDIRMGRECQLKETVLDDQIARINRHEPVQYVVGDSFFFGRRFIVNPHVLIPRPETELLAERAITFALSLPGAQTPRVVDIGTGSGCLAITLALEIPGAGVTATDVSRDALEVAARNAALNHGAVTLLHHDILASDLPGSGFDLVVSNPPYVTKSEATEMGRNVTEFEPALALFVEDDDPYLFYKRIAAAGRSALKLGGGVFVEINEKGGSAVSAIFTEAGYRNVAVTRDLDGKDRIVAAVLAEKP